MHPERVSRASVERLRLQRRMGSSVDFARGKGTLGRRPRWVSMTFVERLKFWSVEYLLGELSSV